MGLTFTLVAGVALAVAGGTFTLVGSDRVDAVASGTKTRHSLALVHVCHRREEAGNEGITDPPRAKLGLRLTLNTRLD